VSETSPEINRRQFLGRVTIALSTIAGAIVGVPMVAYLLSPLIHPVTNVWRSLGPVTNYPPGQTVKAEYEDPSPLPWAGLTARTAVWVRHISVRPDDFTVFAINCTHLGCPVDWVPGGDIFLCPCHGGVFYSDGTVASGPPPRPLSRYPVRVVNGELQILTQPLPVA
jgi:menaquinol-cytochrome c reductase iron-sulfur subunit